MLVHLVFQLFDAALHRHALIFRKFVAFRDQPLDIVDGDAPHNCGDHADDSAADGPVNHRIDIAHNLSSVKSPGYAAGLGLSLTTNKRYLPPRQRKTWSS